MTERGEQSESLISPSDNSTRDFHVVGVGASAGGLEALEKFFSHGTGRHRHGVRRPAASLPGLQEPDGRVALAGARSMPVRLAEHDMPLEPNCVYLHAADEGNDHPRQRRLLLNDKDPRHGLVAADRSFLSIAGARHRRPRASGSFFRAAAAMARAASSRSAARAALVFCESSDTAQFDGMPLSAMRTGTVDQVLPPDEIARAVAALAPSSAARAGPRRAVVHGSRRRRDPAAAARRVRDRFLALQSDARSRGASSGGSALNRSLDIDMYVDQLRSDPRELNLAVPRSSHRGHPFFSRRSGVRDRSSIGCLPEHHRAVTDPHEPDSRLGRRAARRARKRIRSPFCLHEQLDRQAARDQREDPRDRRPQDARWRSRARGLYGEDQLARDQPERLERFFTLRPSGYQISPATARKRSCSRAHNLIQAMRRSRRLASCHVPQPADLLSAARRRATVLSLFHFGLKPGGYMFLGSSESPGGAPRRIRHDRRAREDLPQAAGHRAPARSEAPAAPRRDGSGAPCAAESDARQRGASVAPRPLRSAARSIHAAQLPRRPEWPAR